MAGPVLNRYEIPITLQQISDKLPCIFCREPMKRILMPLEWHYKRQGIEMVARCDVPSHRCSKCGISGYDVRAGVSASEVARDIVEAAGDQEVLRLIEGSLDAGREKLESLNLGS